jgi:hydrogenase maturation protease
VSRPTLIVGLGGAMAGDDAVGLVLARRLAADPRLPPHIEVLEGGADLLRVGGALAHRERVILVDALAAEPGESEPLVGDHPLPVLDERQGHAHHLSAVQALQLLILTEPALAGTRFTWFLVPVHSLGPAASLSPELEARIPHLLDRLLHLA